MEIVKSTISGISLVYTTPKSIKQFSVIWYTKAILLHKPTFLIQLAAGAEIINTFEPDFVDFLSEKSPNSVKIQAYRPESVSKQGSRTIEAVKP